jgi:hypothetical protein
MWQSFFEIFENEKILLKKNLIFYFSKQKQNKKVFSKVTKKNLNNKKTRKRRNFY